VPVVEPPDATPKPAAEIKPAVKTKRCSLMDLLQGSENDAAARERCGTTESAVPK
jgi:hypothetical protein